MSLPCFKLLPAICKQFSNKNVLHYNATNNFLKRGLENTYNFTNCIHGRYLSQDSGKKEHLGNDRIQIYSGMLTSQIKTIKWFSLSTSVLGVGAQPFIYNELSSSGNVPMLVAGCSFIGFFTFVTPFLLHFITKKYITHMEYDTKKDTYIASTVNFFCMRKEVEFKPKDVIVPDVPGMFTTFIAKGQPLFLEARLFEDPTHYIKIMGYDKPMDFKLYDSDKSEDGKEHK